MKRDAEAIKARVNRLAAQGDAEAIKAQAIHRRRSNAATGEKTPHSIRVTDGRGGYRWIDDAAFW